MKKYAILLLTLLCALPLWSCGQKQDNAETTLHIAAAFGSNELNELIDQFKAAHRDCEVVVDYYRDNAYDRLCTELLAGDGPDVLNLYGLSLPPDSPYLEDLYPYLDDDPDLSRDDLVPAVLSSLEVDGALRSLPATFDVVTLSAKTADVGEANRWTLEEMRAALTRHPGQHLLPGEFTRTEFLKWIADVSTGEFIDWASHTASYDSEDFRAYLRFCAYLPDAPASRAERDTWESLARFEVLQNAVCLQQLTDLWGEPFTLIGFPAESGNGSFFECTTLHLGISANSRQKDLAWEFVRLALSRENQQRLAERWYSPVRYDVMTAQLEADVSDEAVRAQYLQLVSQPLIFIGYNEDISQIVLDEGAAFFNGTHTAEEAAERIQNRVTLYLSELA